MKTSTFAGFCLALGATVFSACSASTEVKTEIAKWQYDKQGAVSITYDDGTVNQFRVAVPIMNRLGLPGTFFINTGTLPGSEWTGRFIGRPIEEIIEETKTIPTDTVNFYERASAARYVPVKGANDYFTNAGIEIDAGRKAEACAIIEDFYKKVVNGQLPPVSPRKGNAKADPDELTWDKVRQHTAEGHEFASHMVTHPYMSALDEANIHYELDKSREELLKQVGIRATISAECPYGTGDGRAVGYAQKEYPALRNGMGLDYLYEIHRGVGESPVKPECEYVQWQRGILTATSLDEMKEWTDVTAGQQNLWLVLVIHGIDGIGWEAMTSADMDAYFTHIAADNRLWVATFGDVTRYIKERMHATVTSQRKGDGTVSVSLDHSLDKALFDLPLTLKTDVDPQWNTVDVAQGGKTTTVSVEREGNRAWVTYQAFPGGGEVVLTGK